MQHPRWRIAVAVTTAITVAVGLVACASGGTGLTATITNPATTVHTNGDLTVQVTVTGEPDSVELRVDGELLAVLNQPYTYTWSTTGTDEGSYSLTAVARRGGRSAVSEPRTVVVDRTRPFVVDRIPAPGATNVWHVDPIQVQASEPLLASSVTVGSVALERSGGAPVPATVMLSDDGTTITVIPAESVAVPAELRLTLSEAITDRAGNALVAPAPWTWELPFWQWMGDERLIVDPLNTPTTSVLALTPDGRPLVAWLEERLNTRPPSDVHAAIWTGATWQYLGGRLNGEDRSGPMFTAVYGAVVDDSGAPFVAWTSSNSDQRGYVERWTGTTWERVGGGHFTGSAESIVTVALALDGAGHPVVAWVARTAPGADGTEVRVSRWTGSDWLQLGTARRRDPERGSTVPHLVIDTAGRPVVAWTERSGAESDAPWTVYVERWTGSDWDPLGGSFPATSFLPRLAVDAASGALFIGHLIGSSSDRRLAVRRWDADTGAWELLGSLRTSAATTVIYGGLTVDREGRPVATWVESRPISDGGTTAFTVTQRRTGTQWTSLGDAIESRFFLPDVAVDDAGIVYVTAFIRDTDPVSRHVRVYRSNGAP